LQKCHLRSGAARPEVAADDSIAKSPTSAPRSPANQIGNTSPPTATWPSTRRASDLGRGVCSPRRRALSTYWLSTATAASRSTVPSWARWSLTWARSGCGRWCALWRGDGWPGRWPTWRWPRWWAPQRAEQGLLPRGEHDEECPVAPPPCRPVHIGAYLRERSRRSGASQAVRPTSAFVSTNTTGKTALQRASGYREVPRGTFPWAA
jgi:hypothetical protein